MEKLDIRRLKSSLSKGGNYRTLAIAFIIMLIFYPFAGNFKYKYKIGSVWNYETLEAPFDFPILKSESELNSERTALSANMIPLFEVDLSSSESAFKTLHEEGAKRLSAESTDILSSLLTEAFSRGIEKENSTEIQREVLYIENNGVTHLHSKSDILTPQSAKDFIKNQIIISNPNLLADTAFTSVLDKIELKPNLRFDKVATENILRNAIDAISPTKGIVYMGQFIVAPGEIITEDIAQVLDSLKNEYHKNVGYQGNMVQLIMGHALIILFLFLLVYIAIYFSHYQILRKQNEFNFIIFILCFNFVLIMLFWKFIPQYLYMLPLGVTAIYLYAFVKNRVVIPIYLISILPVLLIADNEIELYLINAASGAVGFVTYSLFDKGWRQFLNGLYLFIAMALVHLGYQLSTTGTYLLENSNIFIDLLVNALLVVMTYHFVTILEKLFRMVAVSSYREWSDTDNRLLRELQQKAPGTFQHSLQVANMSERAVVAIGGDSKLVRAGALYHDIGKILNPQAFIENQAPNINYHKELSPMESASVIIKHVDDGMELARKYKLPQIISNFILTHHAKSMTDYFYYTYCNNGGDPENKGPFTYNGEYPTLKEEVVVMMADAIEAASRSLKEYSDKSISDLVESVVAKRLSNNMLEKADISFKEITIIKKIFKKMLSEIYHARIVYPKLKKDSV